MRQNDNLGPFQRTPHPPSQSGCVRVGGNKEQEVVQKLNGWHMEVSECHETNKYEIDGAAW